jgi:hypothetical protein
MLFYNNTSQRMNMMESSTLLIWCFEPIMLFQFTLFFDCAVIATLPLISHLTLPISLPCGPAALGDINF